MAAPQLRLEVSLNLAGFRNEVRKLTQIAQSEFNPLLKVNVDTKDYRAQLKALEKIKPVIKIEDSQLDAARARIGTLNKSLATLRRATSTPIEIKLKYTEIGKPPSAVAGQIGRAVSGGVRGGQAVEGFNYKQLQATRQMMQAAKMPVGPLGGGRSVEAYLQSIVEGFKNASEESINGLSSGLKDGNSKIANAAKTVGEAGVRAIKNSLGIASPSRVFRQIGEFSVDGLELGFLNGLKDFKNKSVAEIRKIVALMQFELAKVSGASMTPGISRSAGPRGSRQYMSPIGPLPEGSKEPWAFSQYRYQPFMAQPGQTRGANVPPMRQRFPFAGAPPVMPTVPPRMMGRSVPALPPTGGTAATREMMLAMRELEARVRSAARAASIFAEDAATAVNRKLLPAVAAGRDALQRASGQVPLGGLPAGIRGFLPPARGGGGGGNPPVPPPGGGGGGFPSDGMRGPSTQLGAGYYEVGKGLKGIQSAYGQAKKFLDTSRFPVAGAITELGSEFGNAIKQVLLFGTAYKALAFLTSLPGEAFNAAKGLATYRNQLQAVTEATGTFDQSLAFVDNLANRFNVPLASAREGFVKLFASMQPAGFDQGQIENLFTGISKAAATFGLSADKVDRVNYAFAQMASKGQIMSEELKGQLGDVLPGALSLFADAAQMSVPEFSKAMEDGAFKGKAMEQVLDNVAILMNNKFGPAAQGAAKTLQGAVNQIQNNLTLMYESFGPIVDAAAAAFGPQINSLIKDVTETMKVLTGTFTQAGEGFDTLSPRAQAFYAAIQTLRPSLEQAGAALADLGGRLASLLPLFVQVISSAISLASGPLGRSAIIAATAIGILTAALKLLEVTGLKAALKAVYAFIGGLLKIPAATGVARVAIIGLKLALTGVFVGAILMGLDFLIGKLFNIGDAANDSAKDIRGMRKELDAMAGAGDIEGTSKAFLDANTKLAAARKANQKALADLREAKARPEGDTQADINKGVAVANAQTKVDQTYSKVIEAQREVQATRQSRASAVALKDRQDKETQDALTKIDLSGGDGPGKPPKEQSLESYYSLQDQLAKAQTQADIDRLEAAFEHARAMVNAEYDLKEAKANSFQKKAIAFQKEIFAITSEQDAALFKNRNKVLAAAGSVAGGAGGGAGGTGAIFGATGRTFNAPGWVHGHFQNQNREALVKDTVEVVMGLLSKGVSPELGSGARFTSGMNAKQVEALVRQGIGSHKQYASGVGAVDVFMPKGTQVPVPVSGIQNLGGAAGVTGSLPRGSQLMHLDPASRMGVAPGKVTGDVKRDKLAEQQVALTAREANAANIEKEAEATAKLQIATANYVQSLVPTAEQALQNQLLQQRITLTQNSFSPEILEAQLAFAEQELQVTENIKKNTEEINRLTAAGGNNVKGINALTDANNQLKANLPVSAIQLYTKAINEQVLSLAQRNKTAMQDAADQERVNNLIIGGMTRQAAEAKVTAENLRGNYKKALEEATRQVEIAAAAEEVLAAARRLGKEETAEQTAEYNRLAQALRDAKKAKEDLKGKAPEVEGAATGVEGSAAPKTASSYIADGVSAAQERLAELTNTGYQVVQAANAIGDAFGTAFKGLVSGSMTAQEALAGMFQSIADHFADMVAQMIAEYLKMALIKGLGALIGGIFGGGGGFTPLSNEQATSFNFNPGAMTGGTPWTFANGGIAPGGFTAFANGGMVTGPTMGLVGEGRYNEAIVPLPDGKSIPVQLAGGDGGNQIISNITVNVNNGQAQSNATGSNSSEMGRKIEGAVKQVIVGELRPGGLLASKK
jgi:tape measure domain-containing protein